MKYLKILITLIALISSVLPFAPATPAKAAPQDYSYTYNLTNLYANYPLVYLFTSLTDDVEYTWNIQRMGLDGSPLNIIASITRTPAAADLGASGFLFTDFPNIDTPFRVTDNFGRVLGKHFLAHDISTSAYWNTAGENELLNRTEIRRLNASFSPTLVDNNGRSIDGLACCNDTMGDQNNSEYVSRSGDFLLIHYNIDPSVTESSFKIRSLTDSTLRFETNMLEVVDYNLGDGYLFSTGLEYKDFIVLSTIGTETSGYVSIGGCPFCDPLLAVSKFPTSSIPMYTTLPEDYYECARVNDESTSAVTYPCEYMMGIDPSNTPMSLTIPRSSTRVRVGDSVVNIFQLSGSVIWNALTNQDYFLTLGVSASGIPELISALEAAPFTNQRINITADNAFSGVQAYWVMCPNSQFYQSDWLLCLTDTATFTVTSGTNVDFSDSIDSLLSFSGMDNEFSHIMIALFMYIGGFGFILLLSKRLGHSPPKQLYDLVFIGISVLLIVLGWFGIWTTVILVILCVMALMHAISGGNNSEA